MHADLIRPAAVPLLQSDVCGCKRLRMPRVVSRDNCIGGREVAIPTGTAALLQLCRVSHLATCAPSARAVFVTPLSLVPPIACSKPGYGPTPNLRGQCLPVSMGSIRAAAACRC